MNASISKPNDTDFENLFQNPVRINNRKCHWFASQLVPIMAGNELLERSFGFDGREREENPRDLWWNPTPRNLRNCTEKRNRIKTTRLGSEIVWDFPHIRRFFFLSGNATVWWIELLRCFFFFCCAHKQTMNLFYSIFWRISLSFFVNRHWIFIRLTSC